MKMIGILGAGAWGTALALVARRAGRDVILWAREPDVAQAINARHENPVFLPGIALDPGIRATTALAALAAADAVLLVVPAQYMRATTRALAASLGQRRPPVVLCAKGIEDGGALMTEVVAATLPGCAQAVLSGPTFAKEVARGLPTAVTLATTDPALGDALLRAIGTPTFRTYLSPDPVGAEVGGAVKNVLAIACGIVIGRKLGDNARAALITRGLAEIVRLATAIGGRRETCMGLSGLGDLTLTCNGPQSRNLSLGIALGQGRRLAEVVAERRSVAEGVASAAAVIARARREGVDMPIVAAVDAVLNRGADIEAELHALLARPFREETDALLARTTA
ncbi:MAG: NAD(P)-dependent glycerol-3-phosphate dehydrogenase [Alphaproteobacteria bacterium]|nr:NAD(P)-dependent glycerol-3-phosphate dehydrogenase [Alphaproteobacteria bacterium]